MRIKLSLLGHRISLAMAACFSCSRDCVNVYKQRTVMWHEYRLLISLLGHRSSWFETWDEISIKYYVIVINIFLQYACSFSVFVDIGLSRTRYTWRAITHFFQKVEIELVDSQPSKCSSFGLKAYSPNKDPTCTANRIIVLK